MTVDEYLLERERVAEAHLSDSPIIRQAQELRPRGLAFIGADALLERTFEQMREAVEGMIVEGLTLLCGASKIGKSWLVLQLCCAVANGKPFLGRPTEQGAVLYLALEDSPRRLKMRLTQLGEQPDAALSLATQCRALDDGLMEDLQSWVDAVQNPRLIVIDTLQKVRSGSTPARANAYAADYTAMSRLKAFADAHHIAILLVHHLNKLRDVADPYDRISGSTGLMGAADTTILIQRERDSEDAQVSFTGRDVWGDDFTIRRDGARWTAIGAEARAREDYERNPIVRVCRVMLEESFGEQIRITLQDFRDVAAERFGTVVAATNNELGRNLKAIAPRLVQFDGIQISFGHRVGTKTGIYITRRIENSAKST